MRIFLKMVQVKHKNLSKVFLLLTITRTVFYCVVPPQIVLSVRFVRTLGVLTVKSGFLHAVPPQMTVQSVVLGVLFAALMTSERI